MKTMKINLTANNPKELVLLFNNDERLNQFYTLCLSINNWLLVDRFINKYFIFRSEQRKQLFDYFLTEAHINN